MKNNRPEQLEAVLSACRNLNVDIRYDPEYGHFTAMAWESGVHTCSETQARTIQKIIKEQTAHYPNLVCYCFDPFSTLVYTV